MNLASSSNITGGNILRFCLQTSFGICHQIFLTSASSSQRRGCRPLTHTPAIHVFSWVCTNNLRLLQQARLVFELIDCVQSVTRQLVHVTTRGGRERVLRLRAIACLFEGLSICGRRWMIWRSGDLCVQLAIVSISSQEKTSERFILISCKKRFATDL